MGATAKATGVTTQVPVHSISRKDKQQKNTEKMAQLALQKMAQLALPTVSPITTSTYKHTPTHAHIDAVLPTRLANIQATR